MLEKFRKLEERLFCLENEQTESDITFCNPSTVEKSCEESDYITEKEDDLEMHVQNDHEKSPHDLFNIETIETEGEEIYKCSECEFKTTHNPGLKSHMTKMHGNKVKHSCDQCSETFETRKKLKNHIYCIHSGKYKTLTQLIHEANP